MSLSFPIGYVMCSRCTLHVPTRPYTSLHTPTRLPPTRQNLRAGLGGLSSSAGRGRGGLRGRPSGLGGHSRGRGASRATSGLPFISAETLEETIAAGPSTTATLEASSTPPREPTQATAFKTVDNIADSHLDAPGDQPLVVPKHEVSSAGSDFVKTYIDPKAPELSASKDTLDTTTDNETTTQCLL